MSTFPATCPVPEFHSTPLGLHFTVTQRFRQAKPQDGVTVLLGDAHVQCALPVDYLAPFPIPQSHAAAAGVTGIPIPLSDSLGKAETWRG